MWNIRTVDTSYVGTDPTTADNFYNYRIDLSRTGITYDQVKPLLEDEYHELKARNANLAADLQKVIPPQEKVASHAQDEADKAKKDYDTEQAHYATLTPAEQQKAATHLKDSLQNADAKSDKAFLEQAKLTEYKEELSDAQQYPVTDAYIAQQISAIDLNKLSTGEGLSILGMIIRKKYYTDNLFSEQAQECFSGFNTLDMPQVVEAYKPRPLEGVWATPPFLHNGSVPNLWELLGPVSQRSPKFFVGRRVFDPEKVGYVTEPAEGSSSGFWFDTSKPGNLNTGHEFSGPPDAPRPWPKGVIGRGLSDEERGEIIEYLKIHKDLPATENRDPIDCFKLLK
jgi:hypothetical protein